MCISLHAVPHAFSHSISCTCFYRLSCFYFSFSCPFASITEYQYVANIERLGLYCLHRKGRWNFCGLLFSPQGLFSLAQKVFYIYFSNNIKNLTACISNITLYAMSEEQNKGHLRKALLQFCNGKSKILCMFQHIWCYWRTNLSTPPHSPLAPHPLVLILALPNMFFQIWGKIPGYSVLDEIKLLWKP